jgi:hypothetical protein
VHFSLKNIFRKKTYKFYLFTTYFESTSIERNKEFEFCINKNKRAKFDKIYLFVEEKDFIAASKFEVELIKTKSRPTFKDYFRFILNSDFKDSINIIANTDIFFLNLFDIKKNIGRLENGKICFALSRYDYFNKNNVKHFDRSDSQDTWVFSGNSRLDELCYLDFNMGIPGCDNRLAHELSNVGFIVLNPSKSIKTFHLHNVPLRTYENNFIVKVPPPYLYLPPAD